MKSQVSLPVEKALDQLLIDRGEAGILAQGDSYVASFVERWGNLDIEQLKRVVTLSADQDSAFANFILYFTDMSWATKNAILLLTDANPWIRWSSALALGRSLKREALSALCNMLIEYLPPYELRDHNNRKIVWFEIKRVEIPSLLVLYNDPIVVPFLRSALIAVAKIKNTEYYEDADWREDRDNWDLHLLFYVRFIIQALGSYEAWGALTGVIHDGIELNLWRILLIIGSVRSHFEQKYIVRWEQYPALLQTVTEYMDHYFGVHGVELAQCLHDF